MVAPPIYLSASVNDLHQAAITVKGTVTDSQGEPLPGVSVVIRGTTTGTMTDADGNYSISVPNSSAVLVISYVGFRTQEQTVRERTSIDIVLQDANRELDEVVVVGYGVQKKANLTGSVVSIDFEKQALSRPVTNVSTALAGLSSGVQVMQTSGRPGSDGANIRIRGYGTLNDNSPLVIIDGMEGIMDAVLPQDIESISVLKDAASASIFGSRAANGVILITTKKGKQGRINVDYIGRVSFARPTNLIKQVTNYADYMDWMNEAYTNVGKNKIFNQSTIDTWREKSKDPNALNEFGVPNYVAYPNTDWQKAIFDKGVINDHNVSVNGGSEKSRFLLSAGYMNNPGLVENTGLTRYSFRVNVEADVTKWLTIGMMTYASMEDSDPGDFDNANNFLRQTTPGIYPRWNGKNGYPEAPEESATANSLFAFLNAVDGQRKKTRFNTTPYTKVTFMKGLVWNFNLNYKRLWDEQRTWTNAAAAEKVKFSTGESKTFPTNPSEMTTSFYDFSSYSYTLENLIRYNTTINVDHDIAAFVGYNEFYYYGQSNSATKKGLLDPSIHVPGTGINMLSIGGTSTDQALRSIFGRVNYAYKSRYLLEANLRYDGSSRYHTDNRWGAFPSVSAGWRLSEEAFMESTRSFLDNLKVRGSWGSVGNNGGDNVGNYEYQSTYGVNNYSLNGEIAPGLAGTLIPNSLLSWEKVTQSNVGLDAILLKGRLNVEFDLYNKLTSDILYQPDIYLTMGLKTAPRMNIAEIRNRGVETTVGWNDKIGGVQYFVSANFSYNQNEVTKYKGEYNAGWVEKDGKQVWQTNIGNVSTGGVQRVVQGKKMNEYYLLNPYRGDASYFNADGSVNKNGGPKDGMIRTERDMEWVKAMIAGGATFMPNNKVGKNNLWYGDYIYADNNGDDIYGSSNDNQFQGISNQPKYIFGMQLGASWRGFDLSMNWAGAAGFSLYWSPTTGYNSTGMRLGLALPENIATNHYFYDPDNTSDARTNLNAKYPRLTEGESGQNTVASTLFLFKGDYLKLKNLTFGYTLPKKAAKTVFTENIRLYFSGENLFSFTSFPGQDPEMGSTPIYTSLRQLAFGVNVTF